jgi:hypothetical protein
VLIGLAANHGNKDVAMDLYNTEAAFTNVDDNALEQKLGIYLYTGATSLVVLAQKKLTTARQALQAALHGSSSRGKN